MPGDDDLVEGLALRVGEGPAAQPRVVRGEVVGGDRQPPPRNDEHEQPVLGQVARAVPQERVLGTLLLARVVVVRRVQVEQPERSVGDRGLEEVGAEHVVEAGFRLPCALGVELDSVGLDGGAVGTVDARGELRQRIPGPAAGVEDAQRRLAAFGAASLHQARDHLGDAWRRRVEAALRLGCQSHLVSPNGVRSASQRFSGRLVLDPASR